ncbi:tyrosine-type recombinase/integrase [Salegentibacter salarius]|uniref:Integrase n=1 Tax=Salegentibacter salarius TaxID=435906 RepID=A0A2N0U1C8_9FLAO|nr:tyrosine-type recombinase/integrase [Salegentibacter salarius]OEY73643.1 hypothetical protein BHS39_08470 [Salegentibacter salarius]PKD20813.1 hypothetical protein APR40_08465 [Salegentibacter salarius]SLJ95087.1 Phage integrase, N-terminal SAM-like domain [Salegentibacter salarius]
MRTIRLFAFQHRDELQIGITYKFDFKLNDFIKNMEGMRWSRTYSCFYLAYSVNNKKRIYTVLKKIGCIIDYSALKDLKTETVETPEGEHSNLNPQQLEILEEFQNYLNGQRFSKSTLKTYTTFVQRFIAFQRDKLNNITNRRIEIFIEQEIAGKNYAISTHRQCVSALKHFAALHRFPELKAEQISSPRKYKYLPVVLSKEEVIDLLRATQNLKHRAIFALLYSSGLRVGRALQFFQYQGGFTSCMQAGKYQKKVTPHTLRHSYATNMLENDIDLRHIQSLLGHSKPETTMIYTHVTQKELMKITSPLDVSLKALSNSDKKDGNMRLSRNVFD